MNSDESSRFGAILPIWLYTCAKQEPPILFWPKPRSIKSSSESESVSSKGVFCALTSGVFEKAVIISDSGEVTDLSTPSSVHELFMLIESLPTGTVKPSSGQRSIPTALTASNSFESSPGWPLALIQLALRLIS